MLRESDVVHVLHITRFAAWLTEKQCSLSPPYLLTMGGTDVHIDLKKGEYTQVTLDLMEKASYITLFNNEAKQIITKLQPAWVKKLVMVPQGVFFPEFTDGLPSPSVMTEPGIRREGFHLLLPAGLRKVKDVLHVLDAWITLAERIPGFHVTIIGEALEEDVLLQVNQVQESYSFINYRHAVPLREMLQIYHEADVVINTSIEEGQPTALCEAMALGIPVIVRDNPGNRSVVTQGVTGFIYQTKEQFITYVECVHENQTLVEQMIQRARSFIYQQRNMEQEIRAYIQLLDSLKSQ